MADKRKSKQKRNADGELTASKEEYAVAKYLRFTLEPKKGKLVGMEVNYFIGSKAVEILLDSKWVASKAKKETDVLFTNRNSCITFCHGMLEKGLFHTATKIERKKDRGEKGEKVKRKKKTEEESKEEVVEVEKKSSPASTPVVDKKARERKKAKKDKTGEVNEKEGDAKKDGKEDAKKDEEKDKKKKEKLPKLEMADKQIFTGGEQYCVWIYDPVPVKTFIIGLLVVIGAIALCLFPLWPPEVRICIYYISLVGLGLVGVMIVLIILRYIVFCVVWCVSFGKHHFWMFPNLTEDVGFIDSFKPFYTHEFFANEDAKSDAKEHDVGEPTTKIDAEKTSQLEKDIIADATKSKKSRKKNRKSEDVKLKDDGGGEDNKTVAGRGDSDKEDSSGSNGEKDFEVIQYAEVTDEDDKGGDGSHSEVLDADEKKSQ